MDTAQLDAKVDEVVAAKDAAEAALAQMLASRQAWQIAMAALAAAEAAFAAANAALAARRDELIELVEDLLGASVAPINPPPASPGN